MDLLQLRYFKTVAELENMTKAAKELFVAQPAVSKMIHQLENELGGELFDRVGRSIKLNERGKILLSYTNDILQNVDKIYSSLQSGSTASPPITFSVSVGSSLIPRILSDFNSLHPNNQIIVTTNPPSNGVDVELFQSLHEIREENARTILREDIVLAVPKNHPLADKKSINLSEIKNYSIIGPNRSKSYMQLMPPFFQMAGVEPEMSLEIDNPETLRKLINMGFGISFVPKQTWIDTVEENIRFIQIKSPCCYRYINIRWKKGYLPQNAVLFRDFLIDFFANRL
ncbi:MAG: LysR family transcriptional regulator [Oscillospiraceae bacterium]